MEAGVGGVSRRRRTNTDQNAVDSSNLRDFLRVREEDDSGLNSLAGLTLGAVLSCDKRPSPVHMSRTLLDIIRDEEQRGSYKDQNSKKTWKSFKDRLRLRRAGAAWTSSIPIPASDVPIPSCRAEVSQSFPTGMDLTLIMYHFIVYPSRCLISLQTGLDRNRSIRIPNDTVYITGTTAPVHQRDASPPENVVSGSNEPVVTRLAAALEAEREQQQRPAVLETERVGSTAEPVPASEPPTEGPRMSLMALLEETDRQAGIVGPTYLRPEELEDEAEEVEVEVEVDVEEGGEEGVGEYSCCVCMVRHKGAAFIPCGHTFCRLCSRELWVSRGNCPLCNGFILEILDIF